MAKSFYVNCPFCKGLMEVEAASGQVVQKWSPQERAQDSGDKMSSALKKLDDAKKKRAGLFSQKKEELEENRKKVEDSFKSEVERVKKEGVKENPLRPFDLD